jgi:hypothetical protein
MNQALGPGPAHQKVHLIMYNGGPKSIHIHYTIIVGFLTVPQWEQPIPIQYEKYTV